MQTCHSRVTPWAVETPGIARKSEARVACSQKTRCTGHQNTKFGLLCQVSFLLCANHIGTRAKRRGEGDPTRSSDYGGYLAVWCCGQSQTR